MTKYRIGRDRRTVSVPPYGATLVATSRKERTVASSEPAEEPTDAGADSARVTERIVTALRQLPTWGHHDVLREKLMTVLADHERTGDLSAVEHFADSLVMTARMERSPAFLATAERSETPGEPRDIQDVVAEIEARHDDAGA